MQILVHGFGATVRHDGRALSLSIADLIHFAAAGHRPSEWGRTVRTHQPDPNP